MKGITLKGNRYGHGFDFGVWEMIMHYLYKYYDELEEGILSGFNGKSMGRIACK
jgi:hypothetical protein